MSNPEENAIHISPSGESWDVETEASTLASAASKEEALELARAEAPEQQADTIVIHTSEGMIEREIEVPREESQP